MKIKVKDIIVIFKIKQKQMSHQPELPPMAETHEHYARNTF